MLLHGSERMKNKLRMKDKKHIISFLLMITLITAIYPFIIQNPIQTIKVKPENPLPPVMAHLNVSIFPESAKLFPGETETFGAVIYNGTPPFTYRWQINGTATNCSSPMFEFSFKQNCSFILLSVEVTDFHDVFGYASVLVYDPAFIGIPKYIDTELPFSYLLRDNGTHYVAYNGTTWKADYGPSTNASSTLIYAYNHLTSGRTWPEKVVLKGVFTLDTSPVLPSNLIFDAQEAKIIMASGSVNIKFENHYGSPYTGNITILGGVYRGYTTTVATHYCFDLWYCANVKIIGVDASNFRKGVSVSYSHQIYTYDSNFHNPMGYGDSGGGFYFKDSYDSEVKGNIVKVRGTGVMTDTGVSGIRVIENDISAWEGMLNHAIYFSGGTGSQGNTLKSNTIHDRGSVGGLAILIKSPGNIIALNTIYNLDSWGITIDSELASYHADCNIVYGNTFFKCTNTWGGCVYIGSQVGDVTMYGNVTNNQIFGNTYYECGLAIRVSGYDFNSFTDNTQIWGEQIYGCTYGIVVGTPFARNTSIYDNLIVSTTYPISDSGTGTRIKGNEGYNVVGYIQYPCGVWELSPNLYDANGTWSNEANGHDWSEGTYVTYTFGSSGWSDFLQFNGTNMVSSRLQYYIGSSTDSSVTQIDVDVYKDSAWADVYQGTFTEGIWEEKAFTVGVATRQRVRFYATGSGTVYLGELQLSNNQRLVDSGISALGSIANNTLYTCWQSPKVIYISGGTVSSVQVEGQEVFTSTNCTAVLQPSDTFKIVWSSSPTIKVIGQ